MQKIWHYLSNQFENGTDASYKKMLKLSNYHDAYLKTVMQEAPTDPDWAMLYDRYHPEHELFIKRYTDWKAVGGSKKGQTYTLDQMLNMLVSKINKWEAMIQSIDGFEKGTGNYISLFPNGRTPFYNGAKTARVNAVNVLSANLINYEDDYPEIIPIKDEVEAFYALLDQNRDTQEGLKGGTKQLSEQLNTQRIVVAREQYRNLGFLMNKSAETPIKIAPFFELNVLRSSGQTYYTGTLQPGQNEAVLIHTFASDDELSFKITSAQPGIPSSQVTFYLATTPNGKDSEPIHVEANTAKLVVDITQFGITEYDVHRYLTAINGSSHSLQYAVELL